ncbi:hypothetical protein DOTSEDRAFT_54996 [Dothistroma septosporum NZE10]|uniref:2EXR domain-containing protein n=1 Tax=Dothistroma septosporum (strain NZE10 / CBS 128990) TaxID=675120 RepID=N1PJH8_DOTSN|nr:hypothetical protein DOTSEDRAFT_54996 [Dothistroma septosporum NZE10]
MPPESIAKQMATIRKRARTQLRQEHPDLNSIHLLDRMPEGEQADFYGGEQEIAYTRARTSFFALPAEIRNIIYELALISTRELKMKTGEPIPTVEDLKTSQAPAGPCVALLHTSRQIRQEALPIYQGLNTFQIELKCATHKQILQSFGLRILKKWRRAIGKPQFAMLKHVLIQVRLGYISFSDLYRQLSTAF